MSTITKEWLQQAINDYESVRDELPFGLDDYQEKILASLRIALASLEAEPVACMGNGALYHSEEEARADSRYILQPLYTSPPAPVSVPECFKRLLHHAYGMTMGHDWNKGTMAGHHRTKLCQAVEECRAAMLQGAEFVKEANKLPDGWVMVPKEPTEVMFNAGKLAAGPTKQPDTASLVYKAMIEAAPDYKVRNEITYNGYLIQEEVKDSIRKKIHWSPDTEKSVLWVMKHRGIYREPEIWIFGVTFNCVGDGDSSISAKAPVNIVNSTFINCDLPKGDIQFINCTLPAEWEGKVNAIDCVFKADLQQEVK